MSRTIDDLGPEASSAYAEGKQELEKLDPALVLGSRAIPSQIEIDVTTPAFGSQLESLLDLRTRTLPWADFAPPPGYGEQKKRLFTHQIVPSLGSEDKRESQTQKIAKTFAEAKEKGGTPEEELTREKDTFETLFRQVKTLDGIGVEVNARRGQYHRG